MDVSIISVSVGVLVYLVLRGATQRHKEHMKKLDHIISLIDGLSMPDNVTKTLIECPAMIDYECEVVEKLKYDLDRKDKEIEELKAKIEEITTDMKCETCFYNFMIKPLKYAK